MDKKTPTKKKNSISISEKIKQNKKINYNKINKILIKLLLIGFIIFGFWYTLNNTYSNKISLLAVSENSVGEIISGSLIDLNLEIKPGNGNVFVKLNTIEEIDTQISIINSQKIACKLFDLDCKNYDFHYSFDGSSLILKGPSASTAIAILTAKTLKHEKINKNVVITGSLNSGGIIGNVGGIDEKVALAEQQGFSKVIIPVFSTYNESKLSNLSIEVIKAIDIIDAYNNFDGKNYEFKQTNYDKIKYDSMMQNLGELMCARTQELKSQINFTPIDENSSQYQFQIQAQKSYNSSLIAKEIGNYYSMGSFCYNSNINYRVILENQKNLTFEDQLEEVVKLRKLLITDYLSFNSKEFKENILTRNDFYTYLIILDRVEEAKEFINEENIITSKSIDEIYAPKPQIQSIYNNISNDSIIVQINSSMGTSIENASLNNSLNSSITIQNNSKLIKSIKKSARNKNILSYSYALERSYTIGLWETFLTHDGSKISFNEDKIAEACLKINNEIIIKNELLKNYGIQMFDDEVLKQKEYSVFTNKYLCIYKGFELTGRLNTILNSFGINDKNQKEYTLKILDIAKTRLGFNSDGDFPLIPYIYTEYATDLIKQDDLNSGMLYVNYALAYADLNLYLENEFEPNEFVSSSLYDFFNMKILSMLFVFGLLFLIGFL